MKEEINALRKEHPVGNRPAELDSSTTPLPFAGRKIEHMPGHWLLAHMGKKVLRPGGRELTDKMLAALPIEGADVVELAPGLGLTAQLLIDRRVTPRIYSRDRAP